nr:integrase, catalytic region, zinc finger, CCHC-type, peptidase aspartic, catalytic [Tanacetum cinerariifolium]
KHKANVSKNETQKEYRPKVSKSKNVGPRESLATPKPRNPRFLLRWSPTGKMFDSAGKLVAPSGDNVCTSNALEPKSNGFQILLLYLAGYPNLFVVRRFRNLEGVDLLKGDHSTNLYIINLHEMASASPICLMARASFTKSWLWH